MGRCVVPGAGLFEMASAAGSALALPTSNAHILSGASITAPCDISVTAQQQLLICAMNIRSVSFPYRSWLPMKYCMPVHACLLFIQGMVHTSGWLCPCRQGAVEVKSNQTHLKGLLACPAAAGLSAHHPNNSSLSTLLRICAPQHDATGAMDILSVGAYCIL